METVLVLVLAMLLLYWLKRRDAWLIAAGAVGIVSVVVPGVAGAIHWGWTRLSLLLGEVMSRVLLTVVYFVILMPLALAARWMGRPAIRRKPGGSSYFTERNHQYSKEDISHPW